MARVIPCAYAAAIALLYARIACSVAAQAQVDHLRRIGIVGHARNVQAGGPRQAVDDVRIVAIAFADHAHRQIFAAQSIPEP